MTRVTRVKKNTGTNGKKGMEVETINMKSIVPALPISIRDFEKYSVVFNLNRGMTKAKIAKKFHLSYGQVDHIEKTCKLADCPISTFDIAQGMQRLNAGYILLQEEVMAAMTPEKIAKANLAQLSITMGIAADKLKQADAHLSGSMDHTPALVDFKTREALFDRISQLQKRQGIRTIDAKVVEVEDSDSGVGESETEQLDLFPPGSVEVTANKKEHSLGETEVLQRSPVGNLRRKTGVEPRRPDVRPSRRKGTGYAGPGRTEDTS